MAELKYSKHKLRKVQLEEVARYLECNPEKLRMALRHLAVGRSAILYSEDAAVSILPAVPYVEIPPERAAAGAAWYVMANEEMSKILLKACDRLDQAGGKGRNYSFEEMVAEALASRAAEKEASREASYQAVKPALIRYHKMKPGEAKWLN